MSDGKGSGNAPASVIDRLLEAGVFAPLGFVLKRHEVVPELAKAGRQQIAFCQSLGKAALSTLLKQQEGTVKQQEGTTPKEAPAKDIKRPTSTAPSKSSNVAIAGYESLTAREIIAMVPGCSAEQAAWIRSAESTGKKRVTIMRALDARDD